MDLFTTRMERSRTHYPTHVRLDQAAYRNAIEPTDSQAAQHSLVFDYQISAKFKRKHSNPPIWTDVHEHEFEVVFHLRSLKLPTDLYGIDMIEAEQLVQCAIEDIPESINDLSDCSNGTTEQLCQHFAELNLFDSQIEVVAVSVAECPERITLLRLNQDDYSSAHYPQRRTRLIDLLCQRLPQA